MFGFGKNKKDTKSEADKSPDDKKGFFGRLKDGLQKTRANFTRGIATLFSTKSEIDEELLEELETQLLLADVGIDATALIIDDIKMRITQGQLTDPSSLFTALREEMVALLEPVNHPLQISTGEKPFVILMVGINGAGKTTTIGKLAKKFLSQDLTVMLAAGDTFRAAAVEQLQAWGSRNSVPVIAQGTGADSASVIYDAISAAKARGVDVLIADTAGRLHTQSNLMQELKKIHRVIGKLDADAPHEVMLVLDASIGQNALVQASQFHDTIGVTGITITKLDGTAKGGILFAIAKQLAIPIRFIGIGESAEDLRSFEASEFVDALLSEDEQTSI